MGRFYIDQINSNDYDEMTLVHAFAPEKRLEVWKKLGIVPGGPNSEAATGLSKVMTNVNNDVVDLLLHCLRLGIANEYAGLMGITALQEVLTGTASPNEGPVDIGILDPDAVNVLMHGHQPLLAVKVLEMARDPQIQAQARAGRGQPRPQGLWRAVRRTAAIQYRRRSTRMSLRADRQLDSAGADPGHRRRGRDGL